MKTYTGTRWYGGCQVQVDGRPLSLRLDLRNHSPTGFAWGYCGSGPAQLALALLADCLDDDEAALDLYQEFKVSVVAGLPHRGWTLTEDEIRTTCDALREARRAQECA